MKLPCHAFSFSDCPEHGEKASNQSPPIPWVGAHRDLEMDHATTKCLLEGVRGKGKGEGVGKK